MKIESLTFIKNTDPARAYKFTLAKYEVLLDGRRVGWLIHGLATQLFAFNPVGDDLPRGLESYLGRRFCQGGSMMYATNLQDAKQELRDALEKFVPRKSRRATSS